MKTSTFFLKALPVFIGVIKDLVVRMKNAKRENESCPNCLSSEVVLFHTLSSVPVNSCILLATKKEAMNYPKGDISLAFCGGCGFIYNASFDSGLPEYSEKYEETQGFSDTFNAFQRDLAVRLVHRHQLYGKRLVEIGCGKGEFLRLLCELGNNSGVGFDPAYSEARDKSQQEGKIRFVNDFYSEKYADGWGDFFICKMTLEHIARPLDFLGMLRRSIGDRLSTMVFLQVPNVIRILRDCSFEDIYYEHCSYFSSVSLMNLLSRSQFKVLDVSSAYDDQYLLLEGRPCSTKWSFEDSNDIQSLGSLIATFRERYEKKLESWHRALENFRRNEKRVVLWGAGSKGVAFLASLNITDQIQYAVDINPYKKGCYMAGTGQEIVGTDFLPKYAPEVIIVMNPVYRQEIQDTLKEMGLGAELLMLGAEAPEIE